MISQDRHLTSLSPQPSSQPQPQSQSSPSSSSAPTNMATTTSTPITPLSLPQQPSQTSQQYQHQPDPLRHVTSHPSLALAPAIKERQMSSSSEKSARGRAQFQVNAAGAGAVGAGQKVGSRSPSSIPSSPTSVHSSSSAIFERDIEQPLSSPYRDQLQLTSTSPNAPGSGSGALSPPPHAHTHAHSHAHPPNPHRTPRSKITEPIDQAVPSVLDSAVEMLASTNGDEETFISVEAPIPLSPPIHAISRVASVMGSRSPSPTSAQAGRTSKRGSMLLNLPSPPTSVVTGTGTTGTGTPSPPISTGRQLRLSSSPKSPPVGLGQVLAGSTGGANINTSTTTDASNTTTAAMSSLDALQTQTRFPSVPNSLPGEDVESERSPMTTTAEHPGVAFPLVPGSAFGPATPTAATTMRQTPSPTTNTRSLPTVPNHVPGQGQVSTSHPPSPYSASLNLSQSQSPPISANVPIATPPSPTFHATNSKRLSFVSYSDLLSSAPVSTLPLASLTTSASAEAPPPHLPAVGAALSFPNSPVGGSTAGSAAASMLDGVLGSGVGFPNANWKRSSVISGGSGSGAQGINLDDVGGEWEREGLGRGLEERLEALMVASAAAGVNVSAAVVATSGGAGGGANGSNGGGEKDRV